jgi:gliding motility-associated-like protein
VCSNNLPYLWNGKNYTVAGTYTAVFTNTSGCDSIATLLLEIIPVKMSVTKVGICRSEAPYSWNGNSYTSTGRYNYAISIPSSCDSIATLELIVNEASASTTKKVVCLNQLPYSWNANNYSTEGLYTNAAGCDSVATLDLTINQKSIKPFLGNDTAICMMDQLLLSPGGYRSYLWQDNSSSGVFTAKTSGSYHVTVTDAEGCINSDTINISYRENCDDIYFPAAFSPNGDGTNENFGPARGSNIFLVKNYLFQVFNRYGQVVFSSSNPTVNWDGKCKGSVCPQGAYVWRASYLYRNRHMRNRNGTVVLLR